MEYDFIVAHGLYSWVPAPVREHILRIAKQNLAPNGVAYVSYNAYPGCHLRAMLREMMLFHIRGIDDPVERVQQARALVRSLADAVPAKTDGYREFLRLEAETILQRDPNVLFHDELSEHWQPFYFHQFLEQAAAQNLQFLSEASYSDMEDPGVLTFLPESVDRVSRDQYRDFVKCRKFRQTLLCHGDIELDAAAVPERMESLAIGCVARLVGENDGVKEFGGPRGASLKTANPLAIRLLEQCIAAWPGAIPFKTLARGLRGEDRNTARDILFAAFRAGLAELHRSPC